MNSFWQEVRFSFRMFVRNPGPIPGNHAYRHRYWPWYRRSFLADKVNEKHVVWRQCHRPGDIHRNSSHALRGSTARDLHYGAARDEG